MKSTLCQSVNQLRFIIKDTGEGMTKEEINKLFIPLASINHRKNLISQRGLGFGLRITQQLVEKLGGEI